MFKIISAREITAFIGYFLELSLALLTLKIIKDSIELINRQEFNGRALKISVILTITKRERGIHYVAMP